MGQKQTESWEKSLEYRQYIKLLSVMIKKQLAVKNKNNQCSFRTDKKARPYTKKQLYMIHSKKPVQFNGNFMYINFKSQSNCLKTIFDALLYIIKY